jgi:hypothetical protein
LLAVSSSQQQISSSLLNVIANYATTGSNSFRADQSITGSLVVSSTITAQTLVVQTVTSSIVYSSGSNLFGSALGDRQTFTGSLNVTGSMSVTGSANFYNTAADYGLSITNVQDSSQGLLVRSSDNDTGLYILNLQSSVGATSQTWVNRLVVEKGGNVGIGTGTPLTILHINSPAATNATILFGVNGTMNGYLGQAAAANSLSNLAAIGDVVLRSQTNLLFTAGGDTERMRISASGSVSIGTTSTTGQALNTANAGVTNTNTYLGTGQLRVGGGSDHGSSTVLSVAPGVVTFDRPGVGGGALTINSSGYVTLPSQPSFYATSTAGETAYTSGQVIVFNTTRHNTGSHYNTSTGRFTAPVAGKYLLIFQGYLYGGYTNQIVLTVNGSQYTVTDTTPLSFTNASTSQTGGFSLIWELASGDYVEVRARAGGTAQIYRAHSYFSGQLLS